MKNIVYYIAIATVLLFASCASELDTEPSGSQVSDEQLGELIKENADLVLAPMMQGAVNYMHTGNRQATTNDRGSWSGIWVWICRATIWCSRN